MAQYGSLLADMIDRIERPDEAAREAARERQSQLTKPAGALGRLEELHVWAAGVFADPTPPAPAKSIVVAAADHGVADEGVSAYPQAVTKQMVLNLLADGAAVNVLAAQAGARVLVVDAGVAAETSHSDLVVAKVRAGTSNMTSGPAMSTEEVSTLLDRGARLGRELALQAPHAVALGDMGIANTTAAAAITSILTGAAPRLTAGRGTGVDDAAFAAKVAAIERAIAVNAPDPLSPVDVLAKVGGFEMAFLAGVAIGAASSRAAVILDGYPTTAAALIAGVLAPGSVEYMLASHRSAEPGHGIALDHLGLQPLLDLQMRLGEGTGAALAMMLLDAALAIPREMATFESAGVARSERELRGEA